MMNEAALEHELTTYLLRTGWMVVKTDAGRRYIPGKSRGGRALPPGFPDLLAMTPLGKDAGLFLGALVEVKSATGDLRPSQIQFGRELDSWEIPHHLVRSLEQLSCLDLTTQARIVRRVVKESGELVWGLR